MVTKKGILKEEKYKRKGAEKMEKIRNITRACYTTVGAIINRPFSEGNAKSKHNNIENEIMGGNRFRPYSEELKNVPVGADSISAQKHRHIINTHGITLIALVITIILLLILAGVVLNLTLGEHGILKKAQQAGEQYKISEILEKLELEKVDLYARKNGVTPTLQEYVNHLINKGIITSADVEDIDNNTKNIVVEGYVFTVVEENGNIKITYQGKPDDTPRIAKLQVTGTTINSISVKVVASNASGASYKYSIKNVTTGETSFTEVTTLNTNEYTFTGLTINNEYIIQVELITADGGDTKETEGIKTEPPKVTTITLDKTNIDLVKGGTDIITATVLPENAIDKTITWTSSNEAVVTVDDDGNITAVGEGVAIITATSNEVSEVSATCNITVTPPPPPSVGAGADTHEAHEIQYTWEELSELAKIISDNYGTEVGQVNNDTAEVNVSINGKKDTLGIGDWTTVKITEEDNINEYQVRILGFNHDELTTTTTDEEGNEQTISQYGEGTTNTYAGISFEFTECITTSKFNSSNLFGKGWGESLLRGTLNDAIYDILENKQYIKQVDKKYISAYNSSNISISQDKLWALSSSEIWNNGYSIGCYGYAKTKEGERYKFFDVHLGNMGYQNKASVLIKSNQWWLRSPNYSLRAHCSSITVEGALQTKDATSMYGVAPGFAI